MARTRNDLSELRESFTVYENINMPPRHASKTARLQELYALQGEYIMRLEVMLDKAVEALQDAEYRRAEVVEFLADQEDAVYVEVENGLTLVEKHLNEALEMLRK